MKLDSSTSFYKKYQYLANNLKNVIHVAGTNGKGSTIAFLRSILEQSGFTVNVFTSPHLVSENERIRIKGSLISSKYNKELNQIIQADSFSNKLPFFAKYMLKALLAFNEYPANFNIFEVGLGGRLDATNIFKNTLVSVITPIDLDHEDILGNTKELIAKEKAAIIKTNGIVFSSYQTLGVSEILKQEAISKNAKLFVGGIDWYLCNKTRKTYSNKTANIPQTMFDISNCSNESNSEAKELKFNKFSILLQKLPLKGSHQYCNAALAITVLKYIIGNKLSLEAINKGLQKVSWFGRMQVINNNCLYGKVFKNNIVILDGAHNAQGASVIVDYIKSNADNKKVYLVIGMLKSKSIEKYFSVFKEINSIKIYGVSLDKEYNSYSAEEVYKAATSQGLNAYTSKSVKAALNTINKDKDNKITFICGSLYLIGKVLKDNKLLPK